MHSIFLLFPEKPEKHVYVTKPLEEHPNSWRRSFSRQEKDLLKSIDSGNLVRRSVARTIKAIVKRKWKSIPSYAIKTILFHFCDHQTNVGKEQFWSTKNYEYRVFDFLALLQGYLHEKWLPNYFLPNQNLLKKHKEKTLENISTAIKCLWTSEAKVLKLLNSEGEL